MLKNTLFFVSLNILFVGSLDPKINQNWQKNLQICEACKMVVSSIQNGMLRTKGRNFGGGDTSWEEENLCSYAQSEVRLIEIEENLCTDVDLGQNQCSMLAEKWEDHVHEWWFMKTRPDLHDWLCIRQTESCCPENHYGRDCQPCPGYPKACSNNGRCDGSGTREGNGRCVCFDKYNGSDCSSCADKFYMYKTDDFIYCMECDKACFKCTGPSRQQCLECADGWTKNGEFECVEIHEM